MVNEIDNAIAQIEEISALRNFDPYLLQASPSDFTLSLNKGCRIPENIAPFYSEIAQERNMAFENHIKRPFLNALQIAAKQTFIFPQIFLTGILRVYPLTDIALKEIFSSDAELKIILDILQKIKAIGMLAKEIEPLSKEARKLFIQENKNTKKAREEEWLVLWENTLISKLGSFFCDLEILAAIESEAESILKKDTSTFVGRLINKGKPPAKPERLQKFDRYIDR